MNKYYSLGFFPTPFEKLINLSKHFKDYTLFIKRDDQTGLATGGNKTRKLEYLIQDAISQNFDTIITGGAQQSNHCRQSAAAAAKAGLRCHLMLGGAKPETYFKGNLLLSKLLGAQIHFTGGNRKGEEISILKEALIQNGYNPYHIPYGGSNEIGALGYVRAVKELKEQLENLNLTIDYIFFASSSGGMQAGLMMGKELYQLKSHLIGVNIDKEDKPGRTLQEQILDIIRRGKELIDLDKEFSLEEVTLIREYDFAGYGVLTERERNAIQLLAKQEGIILDPVYTGRAFYGMLDYIEQKKIKPGSNILFWHTGGLPAIFNDIIW